MKRLCTFTVVVALTGCAANFVPPAALLSQRAAEERAARDLSVAHSTSAQLATENGRRLYNKAASDLTVILRGAANGTLWNRPLNLSTGGEQYQLRIAPATGRALWAPDTFTSFVPAPNVSQKSIRHRDLQTGVGGALVGIRQTNPREPFAPPFGVTGAVTATVDFHGQDATLTMHDPGKQPSAEVCGSLRPLEADFSAPLAYYPQINEIWVGLMAAIRVNEYLGFTGLYMLQPYDPQRIPIVFVHGLISTPQMWRNVINEIEADPELRGRFQCWVFAYPTGNPVAYSALRLREELAKMHQLYGCPQGVVLVGHSMGGLISHMQSVSMARADWLRVVGPSFAKLDRKLPPAGMVRRSIIFDSNPDIRRVVFLCTPHRGSDLVLGWIGHLGMRLITLPAVLVSDFGKALTLDPTLFTGNAHLLPNGVASLSPKNPTLKVLDTVPIQAPHHSIIGDRGRGDTPKSSDGVVAYWSSHVDSAESEKIVPGPHGSCELPQTIDELKRILKLHLNSADSKRRFPPNSELRAIRLPRRDKQSKDRSPALP